MDADTHAHTQARGGLPRLCDQDPRLPKHTYAPPPVDPSTQEDVDLVLALIAEDDAVLATGHLSGDECHWLANRAHHFGITRLLFTHPSYTVPAWTHPRYVTWSNAEVTPRLPPTSDSGDPGQR